MRKIISITGVLIAGLCLSLAVVGCNKSPAKSSDKMETGKMETDKMKADKMENGKVDKMETDKMEKK